MNPPQKREKLKFEVKVTLTDYGCTGATIRRKSLIRRFKEQVRNIGTTFKVKDNLTSTLWVSDIRVDGVREIK